MSYNREERYELRYAVPNNDGSEQEKVCYPRSAEKKDSNLDMCKRIGYRVISCRKLYPFSMEKNQHNFELIANICFNAMHDMDIGEAEFDSDEYERLSAIKQKAEEYFTYELPIAWVPWDVHQDMTEIAAAAVSHRQEACIRNGRPDLVTLC